jgi:hypothetical protein
MTPDEIINAAYEITVLYDIMVSFEPEAELLSTQQIRALLTLESPLWFVYHYWQGEDNAQLDQITSTIKNIADTAAFEVKPTDYTAETEDELGQEP